LESNFLSSSFPGRKWGKQSSIITNSIAFSDTHTWFLSLFSSLLIPLLLQLVLCFGNAMIWKLEKLRGEDEEMIPTCSLKRDERSSPGIIFMVVMEGFWLEVCLRRTALMEDIMKIWWKRKDEYLKYQSFQGVGPIKLDLIRTPPPPLPLGFGPFLPSAHDMGEC